ncbi:10041_t:CDS:2, partial [Diversispora eburnea]
SLDEMRHPKERLRISNPASVLIVGILYCLTILALIITVPEDFKDYYDDPVTMSAKLGKVINSEVGISILIAISCFGAVGSGIWGNSRLIASVAKARFIPAFSPVLEKFDEKWFTPFNALIFQWCYLTVIIIICLPLGKPYDVLVLRKTEPERPRPFRIDITWVYFFILFSLAIFVGTFFPRPETKNYIETRSQRSRSRFHYSGHGRKYDPDTILAILNELIKINEEAISSRLGHEISSGFCYCAVCARKYIRDTGYSV